MKYLDKLNQKLKERKANQR